MMRHDLRMAFGVGLLSGVYITLIFIRPYSGQIALSELILQLSGSRGTFCLGFSMAELAGFMLRMLPGYCIMMLLGNSMYQYFCTASIYVFSRCPDRMKWYRQTLLPLFSSVLLFECVFVGSSVLLSCLQYRVLFDTAGAFLTAYHLLTYVLWIFAWVLSINIVAIKAGSSSAFLLAMGIQALCTAGLGFLQLFVRNDADAVTIRRLLAWNPVAHTVVGWHFSYASYPISAICSIAFLASFCIFALSVGGIIVQKHNLLTENTEWGTM